MGEGTQRTGDEILLDLYEREFNQLRESQEAAAMPRLRELEGLIGIYRARVAKKQQ